MSEAKSEKRENKPDGVLDTTPKHSRGPFGKGPIPGSSAGFWIHDADGMPIARVMVEGSCTTGNANADLFSAAADLLAACEDLVSAANAVLSANAACNTEGAKKWAGTLAHNLGVLANERERARAAINKAKGGAA